MNQKANYRPNCACHICEKPLYRAPKYLKAGRVPFCTRAHWAIVNRTRDMSHLRTPELNEKRRQTILAHPEKYQYAGGRYIEPEKGYVMVRCPPEFASMARQNGYVLEHRLVMAKHLGRPLQLGEVVHHKKSAEKQNNHLDNLVYYPSHQAHYLENHAQAIAEENHRTRRTASYHLRKLKSA